MGKASRNHYTKEFKFKVAIAAIKADKQLSELAAEFKIHQTLISTWKKQLLEQGAGIFESSPRKADVQSEAVQEDLVKTIGHQAIQIDWLKKKLGIPESWKDAR
jgi:transposase-like protein